MRDLPNVAPRGNDVPQGAFCRFICTVHCWPQWDKNTSKVGLTMWRLLSDSFNRNTGMHCWHHVHVICVIRGTPTVWYNRLATYFTKERHKRVSIMPNEATHSSWESCLWPCRVAPSYHRLTSWWLSPPMLMPPAPPGSPPVSAL